jgi:hypothetical protein
MQGPFNTIVLVSGASATFTAAVFCVMYVAFRLGLARQPRESGVADNENESPRRSSAA